MDMRYGAFAGGSIRNRYPGATTVGSTDYGLMSQIFGGRVRDDDVLVEVGCGKGRVINWWLAQGYRNRIVGLEIMEEVADKTRARLGRFPNVTIVAGDVLTHIPKDGTLFYLFNPFDAPTVGRFKEAMRGECRSRPGHPGSSITPAFMSPCSRPIRSGRSKNAQSCPPARESSRSATRDSL